MKNKKVVFLDIDGTLFGGSHSEVPESTIEALKSTYQDIDYFLATGRSSIMLNCVKVLEPYFKGKILMNGAHLIYENHTIFKESLCGEGVKELINYAKNNYNPDSPFIIGLMTEDYAYINFSNPVIDGIMSQVTDHCTLLNNNDFPELEYLMGWVFAQNEDIDKISKEITILEFYKWGKFGCDVVNPHQDKKEGVKKIIDLFHYDKNNTYAIGNGENDVLMLQEVSIGIAMADSCPKALAVAKEITSTLDDYGIAKAINKIKKQD